MPSRAAFHIASLLFIAACASAQAQQFRAYLSVEGSDANACSLQAPCRLLPAAIAAVNSGGEIWMLDSGNYNTSTVTIGKSVTILAVPGAVGSVVAIDGPALFISEPDLKITLRNLLVVPFPGSPAAIRRGLLLTAASRVTIENSVFANLPADAISASGGATLNIHNTVVRNSAETAVLLSDRSSGSISGSQLIDNRKGVRAIAGTTGLTSASVSESVISGGDNGVSSYALNTSGTARIWVSGSTIHGTQQAIDAAVETIILVPESTGIATVDISGSKVVNNFMFFSQIGSGSAIRTRGNNQFSDNGSSAGAMTTVALQ